MTISSYIKIGAGVGLATGLVSSAFFSGIAQRCERHDNPAAFAAHFFTGLTFVGGPFIGATAGASLYGTKKAVKYLDIAPRTIKVTIAVILAAKVAYELGNDRRS